MQCFILTYSLLQSLRDSLLDHLFTLHGASHAIVTQVHVHKTCQHRLLFMFLLQVIHLKRKAEVQNGAYSYYGVHVYIVLL